MGQMQTKTKKEKGFKFESKEEYFIRNGGILLQKQIQLSQGRETGSRQLKVFSTKDIEEATDCFDPDLILDGVLGTVYKGKLEDRNVAIRVPVDLKPKPELIDLFLTEASTRTAMNHDNMVKLYGCCLESCIPMLVYEFLPNKSLFKHLHGHAASKTSLKWVDRLKIATDISYAVSYMHTALSKPVVHRDIQSYNILLDESFHAKISNFGYSVLITPGESSRRWPVRGTPGYIDPEYVETREVTVNCDVYSFGVLMLELLTGRQPLMMAKEGIDLVEVFVSAAKDNCMMEMIDSGILDQGDRDEIKQVASLALKCVSNEGTERPAMIEVVSELWWIQGRETM